jgi:hypothetical protein
MSPKKAALMLGQNKKRSYPAGNGQTERFRKTPKKRILGQLFCCYSVVPVD